MGTKHNKKRYLIVNYIQKPDKKFDEVVELSKKKNRRWQNGKI